MPKWKDFYLNFEIPGHRISNKVRTQTKKLSFEAPSSSDSKSDWERTTEILHHKRSNYYDVELTDLVRFDTGLVRGCMIY